MYGSPKGQSGEALEETWLGRVVSEDFRRLVDYQETYQPGAVRFDMGERSNFHLMPMANAALEQLLEWGISNIAETLTQKTRYIAEKARDLGLEPLPEDRRAGHYLGLTVPGGIPDNLLSQLLEKRIFVSVRGDSIRITPHLYNTDTDAERLIDALNRLL